MKPIAALTFTLTMLLLTRTATAQIATDEAGLVKQVNSFVDEWHDDAAHARLAYFDKMAKNGVFIGTDKTERWTRDAFREWAKPYFSKPAAWSFKVRERHVSMAPDHSYVWFDEQLDTPFGICQSSGVIHNTGKSLEIEHYQLSLAIPNDVMQKVTETVQSFEAGAK